MQAITLHDRYFIPFISNGNILEAIRKVANKINRDYANKKPLFIAVLNGSFMFAADLLKEITIDCEISFVKLASYHGVNSSGAVTELIGLTENVEYRDIIILEDIVDTGLTLEKVTEIFKHKNCSSVAIATLLYKPEAFTRNYKIDYVCIEIPNEFIVGYGLDYDGLGRNLKDIYKVKN